MKYLFILLMRGLIVTAFVVVVVGLVAGGSGQLPMTVQHYMDMSLAKILGPNLNRDLRELQWAKLNDPYKEEYAQGYADGQAVNLAPFLIQIWNEATRGEGSYAKVMTATNPAYNNEATRQKLTAYWSGYAQAVSFRLGGMRVDLGRPARGCSDGICLLVFKWRPDDLKDYLYIIHQ